MYVQSFFCKLNKKLMGQVFNQVEYVKPHKDIGVIFYYKHQGVIDNGHKE